MRYVLYEKLKGGEAFKLIMIVVLGFLLRLYRLGYASLWHDEIRTYYNLKSSIFEMTGYLSVFDVHPPLYYLILKPWIYFFGYSEFSLRFPSVVFSTLSIVFIFMLSEELFDRKVGLFSALLLSISPYSIYYAQEAKMYSMFWCLGILSFLFFHRFAKNDEDRSLVLYVIFTTLSVYTMYLGVLFLLIQNILFFSFFKNKKTRWLSSQLMILLLCIPLVLGLMLAQIRSCQLMAPHCITWIPISQDYPSLLEYVLVKTTVGVINNTPVELYIYCFLIASAAVTLKNTRSKGYEIDFTESNRMLFAWIAIPAIAFWLANTFIHPILSKYSVRYIGFIHIPLIVLVSKGINKYDTKFKSAILCLLLFMTFSYRLYPLYQYDYRILRDNQREFSNQLHQRAGNNSLILTKPFHIVGYYLKGYEIKPLNYTTLLDARTHKSYDSIFVIYTLRETIDQKYLQKELEGYELQEDYFKFPTGFLWFRRIREEV